MALKWNFFKAVFFFVAFLSAKAPSFCLKRQEPQNNKAAPQKSKRGCKKKVFQSAAVSLAPRLLLW